MEEPGETGLARRTSMGGHPQRMHLNSISHMKRVMDFKMLKLISDTTKTAYSLHMDDTKYLGDVSWGAQPQATARCRLPAFPFSGSLESVKLQESLLSPGRCLFPMLVTQLPVGKVRTCLTSMMRVLPREIRVHRRDSCKVCISTSTWKVKF